MWFAKQTVLCPGPASLERLDLTFSSLSTSLSEKLWPDALRVGRTDGQWVRRGCKETNSHYLPGALAQVVPSQPRRSERRRPTRTSPPGHRASVMEQAHAGEGHGDAVFVAGVDDVVVTNRSAGLCNVFNARFVRTLDVVRRTGRTHPNPAILRSACPAMPVFLHGSAAPV